MKYMAKINGVMEKSTWAGSADAYNRWERRKNVCREGDGWGVTVCFGDTTLRRHIYATRAQARNGDISDDIGKNGRIK